MVRDAGNWCLVFLLHVRPAPCLGDLLRAASLLPGFSSRARIEESDEKYETLSVTLSQKWIHGCPGHLIHVSASWGQVWGTLCLVHSAVGSLDMDGDAVWSIISFSEALAKRKMNSFPWKKEDKSSWRKLPLSSHWVGHAGLGAGHHAWSCTTSFH